MKLAKILLKIVDTVGELLIFLFVKLASILMKIVDIVGESFLVGKLAYIVMKIVFETTCIAIP